MVGIRSFVWTVTVAVALACSGLWTADVPAAEADVAREVLERSGVQGGMVVHLGCGEGALTAALCADDGYLVQGLDRDAEAVRHARERIRSAGLYGDVSADVLRGEHLPYIDNLVNLLVVEDAQGIAREEMLRVLAPEGVACLREDGGWEKIVKPRPAEMDEWTHYLHDPSNNAVSQDALVAPLRRLQWIDEPRYGRHHDHMSSASAMVSADGRLFSIFDHGSPQAILLPSRWKLVARDAFNGTVLWQRPIETWHTQMQRLKSGPSNLPRRLVAVGDTVYVTLGLNAPVSALDAATGETLRTYPRTDATDEVICSDGTLFLVVDPGGGSMKPFQTTDAWHPHERRVMAVDAESGKTLWEKDWKWVVPGTLAVDATRVAFFDGENVVCLDRETGKESWQSEALGEPAPVPNYFAPTLVLHGDLALFSGADPHLKPYHVENGPKLTCLNADTGETLWQSEHPPGGYRSAEDVLVIGDLVWHGDTMNSRQTRTEQTGTFWGRDLHTGKVRVQFPPDVETHWFHHRCYRAKATINYILTSRTGIEFVDFRKQHWDIHHWVRGACLYGVMPANGMVYNPPHPCACYLEAKLYGFNAVAPPSPNHERLMQEADGKRLVEGPAFDDVEETGGESGDWPTLRADSARSGYARCTVKPNVEQAWQAELGGDLTAPVIAGGTLYVAQTDRHTVHALDAAGGERLWSFIAGGRVDSPPTVWRGRVLFGSADGNVYCLRAADGELCWRFRAAPVDLRMGAFGQVESIWPVHGSVLVREQNTASGGPELWCVAGRSMFLDGGLRLLRLDPGTGSVIAEVKMDHRAADSDKTLQNYIGGLNMPVALSDVLCCDDDYVYMRSQRFDSEGKRHAIEAPTWPAARQKGEAAHLFCPTGMLDDVWWHRSYWVYGQVWKSGAGGYYQAGKEAPSGRPLVFDGPTVYGYGRKPQYYRWTTTMEYEVFATQKAPEIVRTGKPQRGFTGGKKPTKHVGRIWTKPVDVLVRAMVLADSGDGRKAIFMAGAPRLVDERQAHKSFDDPETQKLLARQEKALQGAEAGRLVILSAVDGARLSEMQLPDIPTFDGMAAAEGRLYMTTKNGHVLCLGGTTADPR